MTLETDLIEILESDISILRKQISQNYLTLEEFIQRIKPNEDIYLLELILYDFIILENIFTRGGTSEVSFRLALNLALFISSSREDMSSVFEIY